MMNVSNCFSFRKVNKSVSMAIMQSVRQTLHKSSFRFQDDYARIISGVEEGLSSWVTVNYLGGRLFYREVLNNIKCDNIQVEDILRTYSIGLTLNPNPKILNTKLKECV